MKLDRPGIAIILASLIGGGAAEYGVEKAAAAVFLILVGVTLYRSIANTMN